MVMNHFVDQEAEYDYGHSSHTVPRHCTDVPCCLVFLVALAGFAYVCTFGFLYGDPTRVMHLPNSKREFCGKTSSVKDMPFLYFCNTSGVGLKANNTACVAECPSPPTERTRGCMGSSIPYPTRPLWGMLCVPADPVAAANLTNVLGNPIMRPALTVTEVFQSWTALVIVAVVALLLGFAFCYLMETCAYCLFWGSMLTVILLLAAAGGYLIYETKFAGAQLEMLRNIKLPLVSTGDVQKDFIIGVVACALAFICMCLACCGSRMINTALESFKQAADCITDIPSLWLQPFVDVAIQTSIFIFLAVGLGYLVSTAQMDQHEDKFGQYALHYEGKEYVFIGYYIYMFYWIMEMCGALSTFVIAYAVQLWYATTRAGLENDAPCFPSIRGLFVGVTYHLGTMAAGSFIVATVRGFRDFMFLITKQAADSGNSVATCCACCCMCCLDCFNRFLKFMTKNAYMDTAMNSNSFCIAAYHSTMVLLEHAGEVATLNTATAIFQIAGLSGITAGSVFVMHLMCTYWDRFSNPKSPEYVDDKITMYVVAGFIAVFVATPFMLLLDQVSDTLLYCNCIEKKRTPPPPVYPDEDFDKPQGFCGCCCATLHNRRERDSLIAGHHG